MEGKIQTTSRATSWRMRVKFLKGKGTNLDQRENVTTNEEQDPSGRQKLDERLVYGELEHTRSSFSVSEAEIKNRTHSYLTKNLWKPKE